MGHQTHTELLRVAVVPDRPYARQSTRHAAAEHSENCAFVESRAFIAAGETPCEAEDCPEAVYPSMVSIGSPAASRSSARAMFRTDSTASG